MTFTFSIRRAVLANKLWLFLLPLLTACGAGRNLTYFSDLKSTEKYELPITNRAEPTIQVDDLLGITMSSLNPESNFLFNSGTLQTPGAAGAASASEKTNAGFLVDKAGNINYPVIGNIKLAGLTRAEATQKMVEKITQYVKNPTVNIRFLNFKITVVGEVNRPSTLSIPTERINVVEALGLAGDMTPYGKRENVLLIREKDGIRNTVRLDLTNKETLNSPYYYLQQNDIVYVEPEKTKALQASSTTYYLPIFSALVSIASIIVIIVK